MRSDYSDFHENSDSQWKPDMPDTAGILAARIGPIRIGMSGSIPNEVLERGLIYRGC